MYLIESGVSINRTASIPSAGEIEKNGVDLVEMNMTLLKKVEELTLYTLQQQKDIENLKGEISSLKENNK